MRGHFGGLYKVSHENFTYLFRSPSDAPIWRPKYFVAIFYRDRLYLRDPYPYRPEILGTRTTTLPLPAYEKRGSGGRKRPSYGCFREAPSAKNFLGKTPGIHVFSCRDPYRVYLRDVWSDFLDIRGTRTPGRPLRISVKLERSPRGNIPYGCYANTPRAKEMLENYPPPPPPPRIHTVIIMRCLGIGLSYRRGTYPETSPPECSDGGDRAPLNARVMTVTPRRITWTEDYLGKYFFNYEISISPVRRDGISSIPQRIRGISIRIQRGTYPETSSPECRRGGDRAPTDGRDSDVTPRRHG